jgi:CHASE2 domain-containing sensor protein
MAIKVEHELHARRKGRNTGVGLLLLALIGIVFGLTVVKVLQLGEIAQFEKFDHVARPQIIPEEGASE